MIYCPNPSCSNPKDPLNTTGRFCRNCGTQLLIRDRYKLIRPIGRGGFGKTFQVDDNGTAKVLKILLKNYPKAVDLFQREAEVLSQLDHPGIPKVDQEGYFTFFPKNSEHPLHCLVMEKIDGPNLKEWMEVYKNDPISQEQAIEWLKQLAVILEKIHQQNYFHRDIKPQNIMVRRNNQLVLVDFGAVREITQTYMQKLAHEKITGLISEGFSPPEQAAGRAMLQSDYYALGRTFVYLMTGKHPREFAENPETGKLLWRSSAPQISKPFAGLIDYLMASFPGKRPQSSQEILRCIAEIESVLPKSKRSI